MSADYRMCSKYYKLRYVLKIALVEVGMFAWYSVIIHAIFDVQFERWEVDKKQTCMKIETCRLYSRVSWIFLHNVIKIDPYNFELYRLKVGTFFRHSVVLCEKYVLSYN